jgi:hypothetical protein
MGESAINWPHPSEKCLQLEDSSERLLMCRVSDAGPSQTQPRAPGPASGSLQGRNPRNGWAPRVPRSSMGIWALRIGCGIRADAPKPAQWRRRCAGAGRHRRGRAGATVPIDAPPAGCTPIRPGASAAGAGPAMVTSNRAAAREGHWFHEVSIRITAVGADGRCTGEDPRANRSMMIMRPPQQGQGCVKLGGASAGSAAVVSRGGSRAPRSARARARLVARPLLAKRP